MDVDMDDSDGDTGVGGDDGTVSDGDSVGPDGTKSSKKKKSQRFYCTDYPPCNLSFTRSEHLARHIRCVSHIFGQRFIRGVPVVLKVRMLTVAENIPENDRSNVIALADSHGLIT